MDHIDTHAGSIGVPMDSAGVPKDPIGIPVGPNENDDGGAYRDLPTNPPPPSQV